MAQPAAAGVQRVVVVLLDSLNRHLVGAYGGTEFDTPNLDRFAREAGGRHFHRTPVPQRLLHRARRPRPGHGP